MSPFPKLIKSAPDDNVCFAHSPEMRDDYRTFFTVEDLIHYMIAVLLSELSGNPPHDIAEIELTDIPQPVTAESFWILVRRGRQLRQSGVQ